MVKDGKDRITISLASSTAKELKKWAIDADKGFSELAEDLITHGLVEEGRISKVSAAAAAGIGPKVKTVTVGGAAPG